MPTDLTITPFLSAKLLLLFIFGGRRFTQMKKATVFMIEDDIDIARVNQEYLTTVGYEVIAASTLAQARFLLADYRADIILLDVMMPDGDGWGFCAELRERTSVPILFLTCRDENESIVRGFMKGADDYLIKPYDIHVLGARIQALLKRYSLFAEGTIDIPPLHLDMLAGRVLLEDESIPLTQKEMQILSCLMLNAGKKISSRMMQERLGQDADKSVSNAIAVHIANIRKKLRLDTNSCFAIQGTKDGAYIFSRVRY
jgi:DNA-binding response OmpR family regulator